LKFQNQKQKNIEKVKKGTAVYQLEDDKMVFAEICCLLGTPFWYPILRVISQSICPSQTLLSCCDSMQTILCLGFSFAFFTELAASILGGLSNCICFTGLSTGVNNCTQLNLTFFESFCSGSWMVSICNSLTGAGQSMIQALSPFVCFANIAEGLINSSSNFLVAVCPCTVAQATVSGISSSMSNCCISYMPLNCTSGLFTSLFGSALNGVANIPNSYIVGPFNTFISLFSDPCGCCLGLVQGQGPAMELTQGIIKICTLIPGGAQIFMHFSECLSSICPPIGTSLSVLSNIVEGGI
jgi:hypothetical protein